MKPCELCKTLPAETDDGMCLDCAVPFKGKMIKVLVNDWMLSDNDHELIVDKFNRVLSELREDI